MSDDESGYEMSDRSPHHGQASAMQGPTTLAEAVNEHRYPRLLHDRPLAHRAFQAAVHATTLRSWYVRRALRRMAKKLPRGATVLDVGSGSGDHLFYVLRKRRDVRGIGIDRSAEAVGLCRSYAKRRGGLDAEFRCQDVDADPALSRHDLTLCIGMLQYVRRDRELLAAVARALPEHGLLLLYVPVRNERLTPLYELLVEGGGLDYDAVQGRHRVYEPSQVRALLHRTGFQIVSEEQTYGVFGKLAFELHAVALNGLARRGMLPRIAGLLGGAIALPLIAACMAVDFQLPVRRGNGLLVIARPATL